MNNATRKIVKQLADTKRKITDKELFSSNDYRAYLQNIANVVSGRYGRGAKVVTDYGKPEETVACTNDSVIYINTNNVIVRKISDRKEKDLSNIGLIGHESGHILFTDFVFLNKYEKSLLAGKIYPQTPKKKDFPDDFAGNVDELLAVFDEGNTAKLKILIKISSELSNIVEDGYVEKRMKEKFSGEIAAGIDLNNSTYFKDFVSVQEMIDKGYQPFAIFTNLLLQYCKTGKVSNKERISNEYTEVLYACVPTLDTALSEDNAKKRMAVVNKLLVFGWQFLKPMLDSIDNYDSQNSESDGNESEENSEENSNSSESSSNSKNSEQKDNESSGSNSENGNESSNSENESSSKSSNSENSEQENNENSNSGQKSEEEKQQEQEKIAEEIIKALDKQIAKSSEESQNMNTKSVLSSKGKANQTSVGEDEEENEMEENPERMEHQETNIEDMTEYGNGTVTKDNSILKSDNKLDEVLNNIAVNKSEKSLEKQLKEDVGNISYGNIHRGVNVNVHRQSSFNNEEYRYSLIMPKVKPISTMLVKSVQWVLKQRKRGSTERGLYMGTRLDHTSYYKNDGKIFTKRSMPNDNIDMAVGVLVDMSGSMDGERIAAAQLMSLIVYDFCRQLDVPVTIYGHNYSCGVDLYSFAEFDSVDGKDKYRLMNMKARCCNRDGCAVRYVAEKLVKRNEQLKLMIVVSDGQPYAGAYFGTGAEQDLQSIKREYERKGITLFAAAIGDDHDAIRRCYGEHSFLDLSDLNKFPLAVAKLIAQYAL